MNGLSKSSTNTSIDHYMSDDIKKPAPNGSRVKDYHFNHTRTFEEKMWNLELNYTKG